MAGLHSVIAVGEYCALWLVSILAGVHSGWCAHGLVALVCIVVGMILCMIVGLQSGWSA